VVTSDPLVPPPYAEEAAVRGSEPAVRRLGARLAGTMEASVRVGEASLEIVCESAEWKADLLVLGTHGRSGYREHWLGGIAVSALRGAGCNVLMVPPNAMGEDVPAYVAETEAVHAGALAGVG